MNDVITGDVIIYDLVSMDENHNEKKKSYKIMNNNTNNEFDYIYTKSLNELNDFEIEILRLNNLIKSVLEFSECLSHISLHSSFVDIQKYRVLSNEFKDRLIFGEK
jgi:hypothetical protein